MARWPLHVCKGGVGWGGSGVAEGHCSIMKCPDASVAGPGSGPVVFCTFGSMSTDFCSPLVASCAPVPVGTCSAGPSRLGQAQR